MAADRVVIFASKYHSMPDEERADETIPRYAEAALGEFRLPDTDPRLRESFQKIRQLILRNREEHR